ncbi:MAG TPA: helix-turn-helix transcriptional regulator [Longimicrobiales bacterium]|nr:helix-turn-helix transcriptional regulator [Longimicrobiales bacterium]
MGRDTLGEFEHQVLLGALRLGDACYSVPLTLELEERTGKEVAQAAVYITLRRLEKKGLLTSRLDDHAVPETGRERRYFELTPAGLEKLRESRTMLLNLWEGVDALLDRT